MAFVVGVVMLIIGMSLFNLGTDLAMTPIGENVGSALTKSRKLWIIVIVCFLVGCIVTISEPDLQVLAEQVPNIPNAVIIGAVAGGSWHLFGIGSAENTLQNSALLSAGGSLFVSIYTGTNLFQRNSCL